MSIGPVLQPWEEQVMLFMLMVFIKSLSFSSTFVIFKQMSPLTSLKKFQNREIRCCWYSSHETAIIIFKYQKSQGQSLRSDFTPDTSHKAHNGAAKSVRKRPSFPAKEQARSENLPMHFTQTAGREEKREGIIFAILYLDLNCELYCERGFGPCLAST